ncbi:hypothetical protein FRC10_002299 [Ceratobasidium sp. 414]|nr:hypothetical protein FRC10_002299 [Ceratobasidium sp. 414]
MRWQAFLAVLASGVVLAEHDNVQHTLGNQQHLPTGVRTASGDEPTFRKTLVDVLSSDKDYTLLLKALQRARLVPTLNRINGSTLFAPTNDAIRRYAARHPDSAWAALVDDKEGNPHIALRQHLFYHMLNYTATPTTSDSLPAAPATYTHRTLHFPRAPDDGSGPPSHEPPDLPPWMPVPGGLLAGEPQRLRITWRDDAAWVAVGAGAEKGIKVAKEDVEASNGRVVGVSEVLRLPGNLAHIIQHHPRLKTLARYITPDIKQTLANTPHLTLFVPDDAAWDALQPMERLWLDSGYADRDLTDIFARHATIGEKPHETFDDGGIKVGWSENWGSEIAYQSLTSTTLKVQTNSDGTTTVNDGAATVLSRDTYASNGVLHTVGSLLVPPGAPLFKATAEKWLLALNATVFVGMLREAGLSSYVDGTKGGDSKEWTILAPADDVLADITSLWARAQHLKGVELDAMGRTTLDTIHHELRTLLRYHIVPGILESKDLVDGQLVGTELRPDSLKGERMRLKVDVVNNKSRKGQVGALGNGDLAFGGANVIAEPVRVDNTIIYLISRPLTLPPDALNAALSSLSHTTFTSLLYTSGLNVSRPATTLLVPVNDAFMARGLAVKWLMMDEPEARQGLRKVLMHHLVEGIVIGRDLWVGDGDGGKGGKGKKSWGTIEGSDVRVIAGEGDSLLIEASGPDESPLPLTILDTLTRTGALHEVAGVLWPRSVQVGLRELAQAGDGGTMLRLVQRAGMEGVWNGSGVPIENVLGSDFGSTAWNWMSWFGSNDNISEARKRKGGRWAYTLLSPTDAAFARINLTRLLDDREALVSFVRQHIIPVPVVDRDEVGTKSAGTAWADRVVGWFVGPEKGVENLLNGEHAILPSKDRHTSTGRVLSRRYTAAAASPYEPDAETPLPLTSSSNQFGTLLTPYSAYGDVVFTHTGDRGWAVGVKGADSWAHVAAWGRTVGVGSPVSIYTDSNVPVGGGVVQIDRVLEPYAPAWWREWGAALGVGAVGVGSIGLLFYGVAWVWRRDVQEATYEPADGGDDE